MRTAWLVVAEIRFRRRARELVRQQREQRHYVGLLDHLRPLRSLAADHHVDRHLAVGVQRKIDRLQLVIAGKLLVEAGGRIETGDDASHRVAPVGKFRPRPAQAVRTARRRARASACASLRWSRALARCSSAPSRL